MVDDGQGNSRISRLRYALAGPVVVSLLAILTTVILALPLTAEWGVWWGTVGSVCVALTALVIVGQASSRSRPNRSTSTPPSRPHGWFGRGASACFRLGVLAVLALGVVRGAVGGALPVWAASCMVPLSLVLVLAGGFDFLRRWGPMRFDETGAHRPLHRRHGFWLLIIGIALYVPALGSHSLIDPWETHYGEVAREILARGDWTSLWWAQDGWFWSKPVLVFWMQALAMVSFGVAYKPGEMLTGGATSGHLMRPEWAVRLPIVMLALLAVYALYRAVVKSHGRRAGFFGGLVLLTAPQFYFVARQTMTDMPLCAGICVTVALIILGVSTKADREALGYGVRLGPMRFELSAFHLVMGGILLLTIPQILYLASRNVHAGFGADGFMIGWREDAFAAGSYGNCGLVGNEPCALGIAPTHPALAPMIQALLWLQGLVLVVVLLWRERRLRRLYFVAAWAFAAIATMGKGPAGIVLPVAATLVLIVALRRPRLLLELEIPCGLLVFFTIAGPWFLAMWARHGGDFIDRLFFHDMFKRAFRHVHDTNDLDSTTFRYYIWQLGYALFPWSGLAPLALVGWWRPREPRAARSELPAVAIFLGWFVLGFTLFSLMGTKFHHYGLPLVPPLAMLIGILIDRLFRESRSTSRVSGITAVAAPIAACLTAVVGRDLFFASPGRPNQERLIQLFTYRYDRLWPEGIDYRAIFVSATVVVVALFVVALNRRYLTHALRAMGVAACVLSAVVLNGYFQDLAPHWGQREVFEVYERARRELPGPVAAFQMNWKGENFYRGNQIPSFRSSKNRLSDWLDIQRRQGVPRVYVVTQFGRTRSLRREVEAHGNTVFLSDEAMNNKFLIGRIDFKPLQKSAR